MERSGRAAPVPVRWRPPDDGPRDPPDAPSGNADGVGMRRRAIPNRLASCRAITGSGLFPSYSRNKVRGGPRTTGPGSSGGILRPGAADRTGPGWRQLCSAIVKFRDFGSPPGRRGMGAVRECRVTRKFRKWLILWGVPSGFKSRVQFHRGPLLSCPGVARTHARPGRTGDGVQLRPSRNPMTQRSRS